MLVLALISGAGSSASEATLTVSLYTAMVIDDGGSVNDLADVTIIFSFLQSQEA